MLLGIGAALVFAVIFSVLLTVTCQIAGRPIRRRRPTYWPGSGLI